MFAEGGFMQATQKLLHGELTEQIIGLFYAVYRVLGYGFLEKVYENALAYKLRQAGLRVVQQAPLTVFFEDVVVGEFLPTLWWRIRSFSN